MFGKSKYAEKSGKIHKDTNDNPKNGTPPLAVS